MPQFDGTPYTQLTTPARGDIQGVIKDVSEALPENQAKYAALEDMVKYGAWASKVLVVAATGNVTLVDTDPIFVEIDPNGSDRDVSFPAKGNDNHGYFIHHVGGANALTLKRSGGASIGTLAAGEIKYVKPSTISDFSLLSGGGGVSDGDKGDITVSGSGATWTIDNGVVSLAKMANMATASIIGRNTAETGAPEVLSAATVRSLLGLGYNASTDTSSATPTPTGDYHRNFYTLTALAEGATFAAPSGTPANGNMLLVRIKDNATARSLAYNAIYRAVGVTLKTTTTISKTQYFLAVYNSADTKWDVISVGEEA